jgi:hypothetical protein
VTAKRAKSLAAVGDRVSAGAARSAIASEGAIAVRGRFDVEVWSPADHLRAEYGAMRRRLVELSRLPIRLENLSEIVRLRKAIGAVPMELRDRDDVQNLVVTVGLNNLLDNHLSGSTYTAAWYVGLIGSASYTTGVAAGDTMGSHGGWVEDETYDEANRPTASFASASGGSKTLSSAAVFTISGTVTEKGCFLASNSTKGGSTGVLYSGGLFTGGDKTLADNDTLSVSYTATAAAS